MTRKIARGPGEDIAITGMACKYAKAPDLRTYWHNILTKVNAISEPESEWGADRYYDPQSDADDRIYTKAGGFLGDLYRFDPTEFGIMPSSMDGQEPDHFLALKVASDALRDAGCLQPDYDHTNTGIILGHSAYLHRGQGTMVQHGVVLDQTVALLQQLFPELPEDQLQSLRGQMKSKLPPFNADTSPGLSPNVMTGRIANRLDLRGPNYIIDAACASSLVAVAAAIEELRSGRSDLMLAGGVNASSPAEAFILFSHLGGLSRTSSIRPFDATANGTLLGEGLGIVALKRLSDAERDGDRIYALLKAVGQSSDGRGLGLLAPRLEGEVLALERAYEESGLDPNSVSLVEAHGTGIPLGDRTEIKALHAVMGDRRGDLPHCAIGSVKSQISHCIPAAGAASLIKMALSLYYRVLPPTLCESPSPALGIENTPLYVNTEARPWIHPAGAPRRAGVDAFGFGGVNSHAILEEYRGAEPASGAVSAWPCELLLIAADHRGDLLGRLNRLLNWLRHDDADAVPLADVARSLMRDAQTRPDAAQRVAVVADSVGDAVKKIERAMRAVQDPGRHRMQSRNGVYFSDSAVEGRTAFLFPGEGAQYEGMLGDLAMAFPVVREWFDFWETIYDGDRQSLSSMAVFRPPTCISDSVREGLESRLHSLEIGSESMFIATQALYALFGKLGIEADVMLGHSSGENSALVASGLVQLSDKDTLRDYILQLNRVYQEMESAGDIVTGALMTVGGAPRETVLSLVGQSDGKLFLALDNCRHQMVLYGAREDLEAAAKTLKQAGGLVTFLPFDRAYHTPLFAPVSEAVEKLMADIDYGEGKVPVYSCVTTEPFPAEADAIRHLSAQNWCSCVKFKDTVERLYDDGVRNFIEVGPSGNLTAFVGDILRDREHLALPANHRSRSGILQLQRLLGQLFVRGHGATFDYLYDGRSDAQLDFATAPERPKQRGWRLDNTLPFMTLEPEEAASFRRVVNAVLPAPAATAFSDSEPVPPALAEQASAGESAGMPLHGPNTAPYPEAWSDDGDGVPMHLAMPERDWPLLDELLLEEADRVEARTHFDVASQPFVQDHILYCSQVSELDPSLHALPVVAMTCSLEMLAEASALLATQPNLVALENVQAYNWVALDHGTKTVTVKAFRKAADADGTDRIHAEIYDSDMKLLEGDVLFAAVPLDDAPLVPELDEWREPVWEDHELYTNGMFHGPLFQSVGHLLGWDSNGIDAEMADTPCDGFFSDGTRPRFFINPVLLDAVGHLTAFWISQELGTDFSCFPSRIERIELLAANREDTLGCRMRGRMAFLDNGASASRFLEGDFDCVDPEGRALFRIRGWRDRFFTVPHSFFFARTNPREGWYGQDLSALLPDLPDDSLVWFVPPFEAGFLEDAGAVWKRLLAYTVLSAEEREHWHAMSPNPKRRSEWLMGRIAVKEAVRAWIARHTDYLLCPADITLRVDDAGKPYVAAELLAGVTDDVPQVSLAHVQGGTVAAASAPQRPIGIDLETLGTTLAEDVASVALNDNERQALAASPADRRDEWLLRMWCAKEAAAKCIGTGLNGNPAGYTVHMMGSDGLSALVDTDHGQVPVTLCNHEQLIIAVTAS